MIKSKEGFKKFVFDDKRLRKDLDDKITDSFKEAIRVFFEVTMNRVPVYTGMARSSMKYLARWLTQELKRPIDVDLSGLKRNDRWARDRRALGPSLGTRPPFIHKQNNQYGLTSIWFDWESLVPHWLILEDSSNPNNANSPWEAAKAGREALMDYMDTASRRWARGLESYVRFGTDIGEEKI